MCVFQAIFPHLDKIILFIVQASFFTEAQLGEDSTKPQARYVGRKFASLKSIANGRKAFAIDDGRVNRKKSQKSLYNKIWSLKSVCRYFSAPKSVRRFFEKKNPLEIA